MLYNLADVTVVLRGTAQRSSQIFMSHKICCHLMTFHLPRARGCGVVLLGGNVASPLWVSHKDSLLPFFFPAHMLDIMDNLNSCRLADFRIFWQVFSVYCDFFPFVMKTHTLCVPGSPTAHHMLWGVGTGQVCRQLSLLCCVLTLLNSENFLGIQCKVVSNWELAPLDSCSGNTKLWQFLCTKECINYLYQALQHH